MARAYHGVALLLALACQPIDSPDGARAIRAIGAPSEAARPPGSSAAAVLPVRVARVLARGGAILEADSLLALDGRWTTFTAPASLESDAPRPTLVLDFGREIAGRPEVFVGPGSVGHVELTLGESFAELTAPPSAVPFPVRVGFDASGIAGWWAGPASGFRYLAVSVRPEGAGPASVRVDVARAADDGTHDALAGRFESSEPGLDRAWAAGVESARLCLSPGDDPVLFDGVKRDRAVWAADLAIAARTMYASGLPREAVTRSLVRLAGLRPSTDAAVQPIAATDHDGGHLELVDYGAWWLIAARDLWRETGDEVTARRLFPKARAQAEWLTRRIEPDGLVHKRADELEWCYSLHRVGALTAVNVVTSEGLAAAADLARVVGDGASGAAWDRVAIVVRGAVLARLWDPGAGFFLTSLEDRERLSLDANVLPLWFDWLPADDADRVLEATRKRLWSPWGPLNVDRPYPRPDGPEHDGRVWPFLAYLELDARLRPGRDPALGFELVRRTWGHMLAHEPGNTFWEWIGADGDPESPRASLAHAWSGALSAALTERVLGVRCVAPRNFEIAPVLGSLTHVRGTRPSAWGPIHVSVARDAAARRFELHVTMPAGTHVTQFVLPAAEHSLVTLGGRALATATDTSRVADLPVIAQRRLGTVVVRAPAATEYRFEVVDRASPPDGERESADSGLEASRVRPLG
ncbi:MAG: hypothetical protein IPK07_17485 [Deltaproteobacteria bacterium]|nr:hypothetical protein [Deltaproteobacteria bacterium]